MIETVFGWCRYSILKWNGLAHDHLFYFILFFPVIIRLISHGIDMITLSLISLHGFWLVSDILLSVFQLNISWIDQFDLYRYFESTIVNTCMHNNTHAHNEHICLCCIYIRYTGTYTLEYDNFGDFQHIFHTQFIHLNLKK